MDERAVNSSSASMGAIADGSTVEREGFVLHVQDERELAQIRRPHVQAVIYTPPPPPWLIELAEAVRSGAFVVPRTVLEDAGIAEIDSWLHECLPRGAVSPAVRAALQADLLSMVERQGALTGASRFVYRILTDAPSRHCGFHLDTVMAGAPPWGLLRLYNGEGTRYVEPSNVTSMRDVYRYLSRRERLVRQTSEAQSAGNEALRGRLLDEVVALDEARTFLHSPGEVSTVQPGSIVAFKHLDVRLHWSDHPKALAWIHCSPMEGEPRLLANVTARPVPRPRSLRPGLGASAP